MSSLFRRTVCLFVLTAVLFTYGFAVPGASAQSSVTSEIPPKPDLVVTNVIFSKICSAKFTIKNIGASAANFKFRFNAYPVPDTTRWSTPILGLPAGSVATQTWQNVKVFETTKITVFVDPENYVTESNELNNQKSFPVPVECQIWN